MVRISYIVTTNAPLIQVWNYFSHFQNIAEWDPNVKSSRVTKQTEDIIGSVYELLTVFKGKQSQMQYKVTEYEPQKRISLYGKNGMVQAYDYINFSQQGQQTQIQYIADVQLRHILCCFTGCIKKDIEDAGIQAKIGMKNKCDQLFKN